MGGICPVNTVEGSEPYAKGFRHHEWRQVWGGNAQRHTGALSRSKRWGKDYELWNWTGKQASCADMVLQRVEVEQRDWKATRVDIAFDFAVGGDISAPSIGREWEAVTEAQALDSGPTGQGNEVTWTWYIGGKSSERRIRIYRKDIESGQCHSEKDPATGEWIFRGMPPTMRVELMLRGEHAAKALEHVIEGHTALGRFAAAHVQAMTGFTPCDEVGELPKIDRPEPSGIGRKTAAMIDQYGATLEACLAAGVDLERLLKVREDKMSVRTKQRSRKALAQALEVGSDAITWEAIGLLLAR